MSRVRVRRQPSGWTAVASGIGVVIALAAMVSAVGLLLAALLGVVTP